MLIGQVLLPLNLYKKPKTPAQIEQPNTRRKYWMFPKIGGTTPKWMVKIMENPIKMDDLGGKPIFLG